MYDQVTSQTNSWASPEGPEILFLSFQVELAVPIVTNPPPLWNEIIGLSESGVNSMEKVRV